MKSFKFDFAKYNNSIPMIDFLESLSLKERALILKNIEKLIEYKNNNYSAYFTTFFHPFHSQPSTFFAVKQVSEIVA